MDSLKKRVKSSFRTKIRGKRKDNTSNKNQTYDINKQIQNYKTRLSNIGLDPEAQIDTRNPVEKALNLKKDQNVLFDVLEIINRPQQALFGAIDASIKGKDAGKGALEGLTGKKETSGGKILRDLGMEGTGKGNLLTKEGRKNLSLSDVLGFGLDLFADPMDYVLAPVKVTSIAGKTVKTADNLSDVLSKGAKLVKTGDKVGDTARGIAKASTALDTLENVGKTSKIAWKPASSALVSYAGQGIKKGLGVTDTGLEKILKASDARNLKKIENFAARKGISVEDAAKELGRSTDKLNIYKGAKNQLAQTVDRSKNLGGLIRKSKEAENISNITETTGKKVYEAFDNDIRAIVNKEARNADEAADMYKKISKALYTNIDSKYDRTIRGIDVINDLKKGKAVDYFNEDSAKAIVNELKKYGIKASSDGRKVTLLDNTRKLKEISNDLKDKTFGQYLSKEDLVDIEEAQKILNKSPELQELAKKAENSIPNYGRVTDDLTGLDFSNITNREGLMHRTLTDEAKDFKKAQGSYTSANKSFKGRKFKGTANEYNRVIEQGLKEKTEGLVEDVVTGGKTTKKGQNAAKSIYKTDNEGNFIRNANGELIRDDTIQKTLIKQKQDKITKLESELESSKEILKGKTEGLSAIDETKLTKKGLRDVNTLKAEQKFEETVGDLKKLKFDNIPDNSSGVIDDLKNSFTEYRKSKTAYTNALKKKNVTDEELKTLRTAMEKNQKVVTTNMNVAKELQNKQARDIIKNANKAFNKGKEIGKAIEKETQKLANITKKRTMIYEAAEDLQSTIPAQIKYQQAAINKIENSADAIFASKSKLIEQEAKAANILMSKEGIEFMNTGFMENLDDFVKRSPEFNKAAQIYNEALTTGIFNNKKYVKFAEDVAEGKAPYGFVEVDGTQWANKMSAYNGILPEGSKDLARVMDNFKGKKVFVDKDLARLTNIGLDSSKNQVAPLVKVLDGINNTFKKFSTLSLGFQMRNIVGNSTNMVLSGVPARELPKYWTKAHSLWNKADSLMTKFKNGDTLTAAEKADLDVLQDFYKAGFADAYVKGQGLEDIVKGGKGVVGRASKVSAKANEAVDTWNRLALLMYAKDNPKYVSKLGRKDAVDAVKMVLFDPSNISDLERNTFKKIIPFYTFTKQNLMFQAENLMRNTPKYRRLFKTLNKSYDAIGEDSYFSYQKDNMQIPLPFKDKNGNQLFLKANLPVSDLGEFMSRPIGRTLSSTGPLIKTPIEAVTGKSLFTGEDANYTTLKNTINKLNINSKGAENTAQLAETILNGFGMQHVSTNLIKKVQTILDKDNDSISDQQLWAEIFRSVLQNVKQESVVNSGLYDELAQYQSVIKRLKNQGTQVPTMTQINQVNKMKLNRFKNKRATLK